MASHRAMKGLAENADSVRAVASSLLSLGRSPTADTPCVRDGPPVVGGHPAVRQSVIEWTDWEIDFLESLEQRDKAGNAEAAEPLSMRQREKLFELMRAAERYTGYEGFNIKVLVERAYTERFDLDDDEDQEFLTSLKAAMSASLAPSVSGRELRRLLRCCRMLGLIEAHHGSGD